jgi:NO-binding membrane sensor protein with MHYT domain
MDANITSSSGANFTALEGHVVTRSYNPGFVVLSYMISYVGAWTTLELLNKRTSWKGSYNWYMILIP